MLAKTILVVEPEARVGATLALILQTEGHKVAVARSLPEATRLLSGSLFDLVITEAFGQRNIFRFDSTFLTELKASAGDVPVVLCSTLPSTDDLRAGDFGLAAVLPKPFAIDDLLGKVERARSKNNGTLRKQPCRA